MRRFFVVLIFFALFFYLTMIYNSQSFLFLFFSGIILIIALEIMNFMSCDSLEIECAVPKRIVKVGDNIIVDIRFSAASIPSGKVMVCLSCNSDMGKVKQKAKIYGHASSDGDAVFTQVFSGKEVGIYSVKITKVRVFDYLGILELPKRCRNNGQRVYVMPDIYTVQIETSERYSDIAAKMEPDFGYERAVDEFEQIREYQPGDSLHDIHWKLTAKKDKLMVNEHSVTGGIAIHFLLEGKKTSVSKSLLAFIQVVASLSSGIAETGNEHFVAWFDGHTNKFVRMHIQEKWQVYEVMRRIMEYSEDAWGEEPDTEIFVNEYKNQFGIITLPCFLQLNRELSLQRNGEEIIRYKSEKLKRQLKGQKLTI